MKSVNNTLHRRYNMSIKAASAISNKKYFSIIIHLNVINNRYTYSHTALENSIKLLLSWDPVFNPNSMVSIWLVIIFLSTWGIKHKMYYNYKKHIFKIWFHCWYWNPFKLYWGRKFHIICNTKNKTFTFLMKSWKFKCLKHLNIEPFLFQNGIPRANVQITQLVPRYCICHTCDSLSAQSPAPVMGAISHLCLMLGMHTWK